MTYRVTFSKRFQTDGNESTMDPTAQLDVNLADGIVAEKVFIEGFEPEAKHSQEVLDEDDAFLGMSAAEVWEYEVVDGRCSEFEDAIRNSETVMEFIITDETTTDDADLSASVPLADGDSYAPDSGAQIGDGPAGQVTGNTTTDDVDEDLTITNENDPRLGITRPAKKSA